MRWVWILGLSLAAGRAEAGPHFRVPAEDPGLPGADDFWRDVIEPHHEVVAELVARARNALDNLAERTAEGEVPVAQRVRYASDAYGMLRYARRLSPENPEVLSLFGAAADELGKTRQALDALETCVRVQGLDHTGAEVTGRLGMIYLRMGKLDDAIRWLRYAQGPITVLGHAASTVHLATALAARGEMASAIDLLGNALHAQTNSFADPVTLVGFALAVHYDRDEQRGAAFEVLDKMQATLQQELGRFAQHALAGMRFAPPEDEFYYRALLYEALGDTIEARAEWALYAAVPDAPWRRRALDHIHEIDAERSARPDPRHRPPASPSLGRPGSPLRHHSLPVP